MLKKIFPILFFILIVFIAPRAAKAATATGTIESTVYDTVIGFDWGEMSWTASTSASSTITMKVRTATTSDMAFAPDWDSCSAVTNGGDISASDCATDGERYIQYWALLSSEYAGTSTFATPELYGVVIEYEASGVLVSSPYDTLADDTVLFEVRWSETLPSGTDALVQLRSSADASSWTDWLGPDGTVDDYFIDYEGNESLPAVFTDGSGERYFQYRVILDSGGTDLPVLSDITIDFFADIPMITAASPEYVFSNASGTVAVVLNGSGFVAGATLSVASGGSTFTILDKGVSANAVSFNLDTALLFGGPATITVTNPNGAYAVWNGFYANEYRGTFISQAYELPNLYFNEISWTAVETATATIRLKIRTDSLSDLSGASAWSACSFIASGTDISSDPGVTDGERYVQYRAELTAVYGTSTGYFTPELQEITLGYARYAASGTLVSSPYDSAFADNAARSIAWTENLPAGADIKFRIRTAPDSGGSPGTWSDWLGPLTESDYYQNADGHNAVNLIHNDGESDQWLQYQAFLSSDGAAAPVLSDITIEYGGQKYSTIIINDTTILNDAVIFR